MTPDLQRPHHSGAWTTPYPCAGNAWASASGMHGGEGQTTVDAIGINLTRVFRHGLASGPLGLDVTRCDSQFLTRTTPSKTLARVSPPFLACGVSTSLDGLAERICSDPNTLAAPLWSCVFTE